MLFSHRSLLFCSMLIGACMTSTAASCDVDFFLINADEDVEVGKLQPGPFQRPDFRASIEARPSRGCPRVESAYMELDGPIDEERVENKAPYAIFSNRGRSDFRGRRLRTGEYTIKTSFFTRNRRRGRRVARDRVKFEVIPAGQCNIGNGIEFKVDLNIDEEIPSPVGAENSSGDALVTVCSKSNQVCLDLESHLTGNPGEAAGGHLHQAPIGETGPVVVNFGVQFPEFVGCVDAEPALIDMILDDPTQFYVNIHTPMNAPGEIRGQLGLEDISSDSSSSDSDSEDR